MLLAWTSGLGGLPGGVSPETCDLTWPGYACTPASAGQSRLSSQRSHLSAPSYNCQAHITDGNTHTHTHISTYTHIHTRGSVGFFFLMNFCFVRFLKEPLKCSVSTSGGRNSSSLKWEKSALHDWPTHFAVRLNGGSEVRHLQELWLAKTAWMNEEVNKVIDISAVWRQHTFPAKTLSSFVLSLSWAPCWDHGFLLKRLNLCCHWYDYLCVVSVR